jgi:hypothetical protein
MSQRTKELILNTELKPKKAKRRGRKAIVTPAMLTNQAASDEVKALNKQILHLESVVERLLDEVAQNEEEIMEEITTEDIAFDADVFAVNNMDDDFQEGVQSLVTEATREFVFTDMDPIDDKNEIEGLQGEVTIEALLAEINSLREEIRTNKVEGLDSKKKYTTPQEQERVRLSQLSISDLRAEAKNKGITGYAQMTKSQLIEKLVK